jgi:hypothetical protein
MTIFWGISMSLSDLAAIGSLGSSLAVLVSLVYLAQQTRQSTKHARALIQQGRAERTFELLIRWAEFEWTDGMEACLDGSPDVNPRDLRRYISLMRAMLVNYEDSFLQHEEGLLQGQAFENVESALRSAMSTPGARRAWGVIRGFFGAGFQKYMDNIIAKGPSLQVSFTQMARWKAVGADELERPVR